MEFRARILRFGASGFESIRWNSFTPRGLMSSGVPHKKILTSLVPPQDPRHGPEVGSYGGAVSDKRGTPAMFGVGCLVFSV